MATVLYVSKPVEPPWNDSSKNLVRDLATHLARHEALVLTRRGGRAPAGLRSLATYGEGGGFAPALAEQGRVLARLVTERRADVWHFFFAPNPRSSSAARWMQRLRRRPTVHTVCSAPRPDARLDAVLFADRTVVLSRHTERRVEAAGRAVTRIPPCVAAHAPLDDAARRSTRARLQLPEAEPLVLYPGDLEFGRGARTTLEAFARLPRGAHLVMACRRKTPAARQAEDELHALAARVAPARVHWVGETPEILALVGAVDVVALPTETLYAKMDYPLVVLEAMAMARPVVVAEGTAAAELGAHGALVVPAEVEALTRALDDLLGDPSGARARGLSGRAAALSSFSPRAMAETYERLYDELVG
ncbi:MAG: glycosyltransferase family 4 protein [Myxococcales bacterium]|nr:glycosyltransferase family 4 protein [Myxococcales bacterium]